MYNPMADDVQSTSALAIAPPEKPMVVAIVDLGAYTARLEIYQVLPDGRIDILEDLSHPLPLGSDVFTTGRIRAANLRLTERVMEDFSRLMSEYQVEYCKAVATSAVRESLNRDIFLHRIRRKTGVEVEILEGTEEIRLIYLAVKRALGGRFPFTKTNYVIYTIGTGSSQICFFQKDRLHSADTIRLGTLRLVEGLGERLTPQRLREIVDPFMAAILAGIARMSVTAHPEHIIAVGAPARGLVTVGREHLPKYMARLRRKTFESLFATVSHSTIAELVAKYELTDTVARGLEPCCHMLEHLFEVTGCDNLVVPMINTRDALLEDLMRQISGRPDPFIPEIISAAESLGERYSYDAVHARNVADLSLSLFDQTGDMHGLPPRCRLLLEVAGLIHDIGLFVSSRAHHKHSYYLVKNSELPGISSDEQELLATIVRYHRRALPKVAHAEYMSLDSEKRVMVSKMAALLRVADALDRSHQGKIRRVKVHAEGDRLLVSVAGPDDVALEQWALARKADMFREVFGCSVVLVGTGDGR